MSRPNIIFLMTDQLRGDCLGYAGHPDVKTPYLDTLASTGTAFDRAYSACPSCIASRAAIHTGMGQNHHGRVGYLDGVPWEYEHTLAGELGQAGYNTQCVGKMHVHPLRNYLGFHHVELHDGYLGYSRRATIPYRESQLVADDYFYWLKNELGISADVTDTGIECNSYVARPWMHEEKYHPTNWVTERSIDFLRRRDPGKPFFLMASYLRPHPPFDAPRHYFDLYRDQELRPPYVGTWETDELLKRDGRIYDSKTGPIDAELIRQAQVGYYACITHLDHQIGRLILALKEQELYDNSIIIFTADHGEELCDHHMFRKARPYEGSCHIPLIISGGKKFLPKGAGSSRCSSVVELRDIMPTLLDLADAPVPDTVDGKSLLPLLEDPARSVRPWLHGEHSFDEYSNHWIVTETDKYIWHSQTGQEQYFHLEKDPHELTDLIEEDACKMRIQELRGHLIESLENRREGFVENGRLVPGRPYPPVLS